MGIPVRLELDSSGSLDSEFENSDSSRLFFVFMPAPAFFHGLGDLIKQLKIARFKPGVNMM